MQPAKTTENSAFCGACGGEVISFVQQPHMWHLVLDHNAFPDAPNAIDEYICIGCATDIIKFRAEVLAHKWDAAKASVDK